MGVKFSLNLRVIETRCTKALSVVNSGSVEHLQKRLNVEYPRSFSSGRGLWLRFDRRLKSTELLLNLHSMERKANLPYFQISIFAANLWNNFPKLLPTFSQN